MSQYATVPAAVKGAGVPQEDPIAPLYPLLRGESGLVLSSLRNLSLADSGSDEDLQHFEDQQMMAQWVADQMADVMGG